MITKKETKARKKKKKLIKTDTNLLSFLSPSCNENLCVERNSLAFKNMFVKEPVKIQALLVSHTHSYTYTYTQY